MEKKLFDIEGLCQAQLEKLHRLGQPVYDHKLFQDGWEQVHHKHTTVSMHSEHVAAVALHLAERLGMTVDEESLVLGALSHDLGIIGRYEKFKSEMETYIKHPKDSVEIAKDFLGEKFNATIDDMIRHHMWPLSDKAPESKEGILIVMADKICAIQESGYAFAKIRKQLYHWMIG